MAAQLTLSSELVLFRSEDEHGPRARRAQVRGHTNI